MSNVRAAYAEASTAYLTAESGGKATYTAAFGTNSAKVVVSGIVVKGEQANGAFNKTQLPCDVSVVKDSLDKAADDAAKTTGISLTFTWDANDKCTVTAGS